MAAIYRSRTRIEDFPRGFNEPVVVMQEANADDLFEGSCVYRLKGTNQYLCLVECIGKNWAPLLPRLHGRPPRRRVEAVARRGLRATPFAGDTNVSAERAASPLWAEGVSHGELLREGSDETMTVDPKNLRSSTKASRDGSQRARLRPPPSGSGSSNPRPPLSHPLPADEIPAPIARPSRAKAQVKAMSADSSRSASNRPALNPDSITHFRPSSPFPMRILTLLTATALLVSLVSAAEQHVNSRPTPLASIANTPAGPNGAAARPPSRPR